MRTVIHLVVLAGILALTCSISAKQRYARSGPPHLDRAGEKWVRSTLNKMSTEEKVGQLFMVWARAQFFNVNSLEYRQFTEQIQRYHIGSFALSVPVEGPFIIRSQPYEAAMLLNHLQELSKLPLLIAADFESGLSSRLNGTTVFPQAMAFGAAGKTEYAESFGKITALEARAIGVHWNFFPVVDVNSNPSNPIINVRSFGENPQQVGEMAAAYIQGARSNGMLTTAKHFPGHGDTATDSHLGVALLEFRNMLASTQDVNVKGQVRSLKRRNGQVMTKSSGEGFVYGPYKMDQRKKLLRTLLETQKQIRAKGPKAEETLITADELEQIRRLWRTEEQDWEDSVPKIYEEVTGEDLDWIADELPAFSSEERKTLDHICARHGVSPDMVAKLLDVERTFHAISRRAGVYQKISSVLAEEWRSEEAILASGEKSEE
jgi:Glycosyl hydrolase family 3 N terminal domain